MKDGRKVESRKEDKDLIGSFIDKAKALKYFSPYQAIGPPSFVLEVCSCLQPEYVQDMG